MDQGVLSQLLEIGVVPRMGRCGVAQRGIRKSPPESCKGHGGGGRQIRLRCPGDQLREAPEGGWVLDSFDHPKSGES